MHGCQYESTSYSQFRGNYRHEGHCDNMFSKVLKRPPLDLWNGRHLRTLLIRSTERGHGGHAETLDSKEEPLHVKVFNISNRGAEMLMSLCTDNRMTLLTVRSVSIWRLCQSALLKKSVPLIT